jgi:predicted amidohydrolase YtcJ
LQARRREEIASYANPTLPGRSRGRPSRRGLTPGKLADVVVLSRDILTCPPEEILQTEVDYTIVGGQIRFQREEE